MGNLIFIGEPVKHEGPEDLEGLKVTSQTINTAELGFPSVMIRLDGEFDAYTFYEFKEKVDGQLQANIIIVIDLLKVEYFDSTGLGCLVELLRKAEEQSGKVWLLVPPHKEDRPNNIRRVFEITRLNDRFPMFASEQEVAAALQAEKN